MKEKNNIISDWLNKYGTKEMDEQVEKELENMFIGKVFNEIKRTMIASLLIEQATELKGKRPSELGFEELIDVVQAVVKNCFMPDVVGQSEQLADDKSYQPCDGCNTSCKEWEIFFCKKLG